MTLHTQETLAKLKQAREATRKARQTTNDAKRTTEELEAKLQRLKQEHDDCRAALRTARAAEDNAYTNYAQTLSRNFATAFLSALPRELRDHVYSYVWDDEDTLRQTKRCIREYAWSYRMPELCAPPYVQPDHVGETVAEELAMSIYKKAFKTNLHVTVSAGHIHKFLAANPLKSNLKPADCIKALDIEWYPNEYSDKDVARSFRDLSTYEFPNPIPIRLIVGKIVGGTGGTPESATALVDGLGVFKPAYNALIKRRCPVTIERLG